MMAIHILREDLLEAAAEPVLERLRADAARIDEPLRSVVQHLHDHLFDEDLDASSLFRAARMRGGSAKMRFRTWLQQTPRRYLESARFGVVLRLLEHGDEESMATIACAVGYGITTFFDAFKRRFGVPPGEIRRQLAEGRTTVSVLERAFLAPLESSRLEFDFGQNVPVSRALQQGEPPFKDELTIDRQLFEAVSGAMLHGGTLQEYLELATAGFRFRTEALFEWLLRESREGCRDDRPRGVKLAELAVEALEALRERSSAEAFRNLRVTGLSWLGTARRLAEDLVGAERAFAEAEQELARGEVELEVLADFLEYKGFLRALQRSLREATLLLGQACALRRRLGHQNRLARALMCRGIAFRFWGNYEQAAADQLEAAALVEGSEAPNSYLLMAIHDHLAVSSLKFGDLEAARRHLRRFEVLAGELDSREVEPRLLWIKGLLAQAEGEHEVARRRFQNAHSHLLTKHQTGAAAIISLDLAMLELAVHRPQAARRLASEALAPLRVLQLDREALAALGLLEEALGTKRFTLELLVDLRSALESRLLWLG